MDGFERRIAVLLQDSVPEPDQDVSVAEIERLGRRRRALAVAAPVVAAVVVILAVVAAITVAGHRDKPVQPATPTTTQSTTRVATRTATADLGGISVQYPAQWHRVALRSKADIAKNPIAAEGDPTAFLTSGEVTTVCQKVIPSGQYCQKGVAHLGADQVYVGYNTFTPYNGAAFDPGLDIKIAGRLASSTEMANVNEFCPIGTASTTQVVIKVKTRYLSITGCLGGAKAAAQVFQRLVDSARYTP